MKLRSILATDCGSTTTKAILIELMDGEYRLQVRGEAPTTVEAPFEDVTRGVLNAIMELEELSSRTILDGENIIFSKLIIVPNKESCMISTYIHNAYKKNIGKIAVVLKSKVNEIDDESNDKLIKAIEEFKSGYVD